MILQVNLSSEDSEAVASTLPLERMSEAEQFKALKMIKGRSPLS